MVRFAHSLDSCILAEALAMDLAEVEERLEPVYNWFTEGHGAADIVATRTLLSEIG